MKTIMITTDFSDNAWKAASFGANVYCAIPCHYIIVHAYHVSSGMVEVDIAKIISSMSKEVNDSLMTFKSSFEQLDHHNDTTFEYVDRFGETAHVILEIAKAKFADLIILGTRGSANNWSFAFGSTTVELISSSPFPILAIPAETKLEPLKQLMLATDYENISNLDTLKSVKEIAETQKSEILVVNVRKNERSKASAEQGMEGLAIHNFFDDIPHDYFDLVADNVETGLLNFAEQKEVDLIVVINHERKFWKDLFHSSISKKMGLYSSVPLLVLRD